MGLAKRPSALMGLASMMHCFRPAVLAARPPMCHGGGWRRHHRRRNWDGGKKQHGADDAGADDGKLVVTIDLEEMGRGARAALQRVANVGNTLADEWRRSVAVKREGGVVIAVRHSTLDLVGRGALCLVLVALAAKALVAMARKYRWGWEEALDAKTVVRRDRSLGGKEIVVPRPQVHKAPSPLDGITSAYNKDEQGKRVQQQRQLPQWWSVAEISTSKSDSGAQAQANALVQVIMQKRLSGVDFVEDDILQLRQICRNSGARAGFDAGNTRDSFFRAAVNFVLSACARHSPPTSLVRYGGESATSFIAGLAANINLDAPRAACIVNAAIAARTRSGFLQAWAYNVQGKASEAEEEIRKLVCMHVVFPLEPNSPEMEMVGRGLESHLALDERICLLHMYNKLGSHTKRTALEALSLDSAVE